MFSLKQKAAQTAKRAGLMTVGILLCAIGAGFCTAAAWLQLSVTFSATKTALIIAAIYVGIGLVLIAAGRSPSKNVEPTGAFTTETKSDAPPLMQAFLHGMQAGAHAKASKRK
ncbi:MAG: phage holin family protein [Sulfitobacter sp.]